MDVLLILLIIVIIISIIVFVNRVVFLREKYKNIDDKDFIKYKDASNSYPDGSVIEAISFDRKDNTQLYYILRKRNEHYLINNNEANSKVNVRTLYPNFSGNIIDIIVNGKDTYILSDNGNLYNPHNYQLNFILTWNDIPISSVLAMDYSNDIPITNKNRAFPELDFDFIFYYKDNGDTIKYKNNGCLLFTGTMFGRTFNNQMCCACNPPNNPDVIKTKININNFFSVSNNQYYINNGNILSDTGTNLGNIFSIITKPVIDFEDITYDVSELILISADHNNNKPFFLVNENNTYYIVETDATKFKLSELFPKFSSNVLAMTKLSVQPIDYLLFDTDGYMYNYYFSKDEYGRKVIKYGYDTPGTIESRIFPNGYDKNIMYLVSVSNLHTETSNTLLFFYSDGSWYDISYTIDDKNSYKTLDITDIKKRETLWTDWVHYKQSKIDYPNSMIENISYLDLRIYLDNGKIYYMDKIFPNSVGISDWKDELRNINTTNLNPDNKNVEDMTGYIKYKEFKSGNIPTKTINTIDYTSCKSECDKDDNLSAFIYDSLEKNCMLYHELSSNMNQYGKNFDTYVKKNSQVHYENKFCVKNTKLNKYAYLTLPTDDNSTSHVGMTDKCACTNADKDCVIKESSGTMWSMSSSMNNLNPGFGNKYGFCDGDDCSKGVDNGKWYVGQDNNLHGKGGCYKLGNDNKLEIDVDCSSKEWGLEAIPCEFINDKKICQNTGKDEGDCIGPIFKMICSKI